MRLIFYLYFVPWNSLGKCLGRNYFRELYILRDASAPVSRHFSLFPSSIPLFLPLVFLFRSLCLSSLPVQLTNAPTTDSGRCSLFHWLVLRNKSDSHFPSRCWQCLWDREIEVGKAPFTSQGKNHRAVTSNERREPGGRHHPSRRAIVLQ